MALLLPKSEEIWRNYDQAMKTLLDQDKCSIDAGLLAVNAISSAKRVNHFRGKMNSNVALLNLISRQKVAMSGPNKTGNVFDQIEPAHESGFGSPAASLTAELFTPIGSGKVRDSKELERLGVMLNLLALSPEARKDHQAVMRDVTDYGVKVLTMQQNPVRLSTLRVLWQNAPHSQLLSSYLFYKILYEQVLYSITCEPLQLVREEASVAKLLESMVRSKFKSSQLINKLHELISQQGLSYKRMGMEIFGYLIELDSTPFALSILDYYMENSTGDEIATSISNGSGHRGALTLPEKAREHLFNRLMQQNTFQYGDLAILLLNAGRTDHHKTSQQLLNKVEIALTRTIADLSPARAISLLRGYGYAGRNYPPIVTALNGIIAKNVGVVPQRVLLTALWASARLNDRDAEYIPGVVKKYFDDLRGMDRINAHSLDTLVHVLWALSVMEKLELAHFSEARRLIEKFMISRGGQDLNYWTENQLSQVWCEVQVVLQREGKEVSEVVPPADKVANKVLQNLAWYRTSPAVIDDPESSLTHLDASRLLIQIGVTHQNEVQVRNGYVVDTFIPISALPEVAAESAANYRTTVPDWMRTAVIGQAAKTPEAVATGATPAAAEAAAVTEKAEKIDKPVVKCEGVVLEFDGPTHFESYMHVSLALHRTSSLQQMVAYVYTFYLLIFHPLQRELGPTVMKRRHLEALGLRVVNVPFWNYKLDMTEENKVTLLRQYVNRLRAGL
jgi:hypothetical protein